MQYTGVIKINATHTHSNDTKSRENMETKTEIELENMYNQGKTINFIYTWYALSSSTYLPTNIIPPISQSHVIAKTKHRHKMHFYLK